MHIGTAEGSLAPPFGTRAVSHYPSHGLRAADAAEPSRHDQRLATSAAVNSDIIKTTSAANAKPGRPALLNDSTILQVTSGHFMTHLAL